MTFSCASHGRVYQSVDELTPALPVPQSLSLFFFFFIFPFFFLLSLSLVPRLGIELGGRRGLLERALLFSQALPVA